MPVARARVIATAGESYIVFGRDAARGKRFPAVFAFASLLPDAGGDGSSGFVLTGARVRLRGLCGAVPPGIKDDDDVAIGALGGEGRGTRAGRRDLRGLRPTLTLLLIGDGPPSPGDLLGPKNALPVHVAPFGMPLAAARCVSRAQGRGARASLTRQGLAAHSRSHEWRESPWSRL